MKRNKPTAIVTGSSSGIGQQIAISLARKGYQIVINYHSDKEGAEATLEDVKKSGGRGITHHADVSNPEEVNSLISQTVSELGGLDVMICNAGIQKDAPFLDMSFDDWKKVIDVNLHGQFLCAQAAARHFIANNEPEQGKRTRGNIVCMSSVHDIIPWEGHINYATAKGGVLMFMKTLAQELGPMKIRVNGVAPGAIKTPINEEVWKDEKQREQLKELIPYRRIGETEDVARVVAWLVSDDADYIHGHMLYIDGGMTLYPGFIDNG